MKVLKFDETSDNGKHIHTLNSFSIVEMVIKNRYREPGR